MLTYADVYGSHLQVDGDYRLTEGGSAGDLPAYSCAFTACTSDLRTCFDLSSREVRCRMLTYADVC